MCCKHPVSLVCRGCQGNADGLAYGSGGDEVDTGRRINLGHAGLGQDAASQAEAGGLVDATLGVGDGADLGAEADLSEGGGGRQRGVAVTGRDGKDDG